MLTTVRSIQERSFEFAARILLLCERYERNRSFVLRTLARQLLKSGTSVGANVEEASAAQSKADFVSKCSIASKEARETRYWLRLLERSSSGKAPDLAPLVVEAGEIVAILTSILKKATTRTPARAATP